MTIYSATIYRLSTVILPCGHVYRPTLHSSCRETYRNRPASWCRRVAQFFPNRILSFNVPPGSWKRQSTIHQPSIVGGYADDVRRPVALTFMSTKRMDACCRSLVPRYLRTILSFDWTVDEGEPTKDHQPSERVHRRSRPPPLCSQRPPVYT